MKRYCCEGCGAWFTLDEVDKYLEHEYDEYYSHSYQIAVDDFRKCGPVIILPDDILEGKDEI